MTTQPTHTPGPWHIGMRPGPMVYGQLGEQVADCRGLDESQYNARLIAACPDMLEALKDLLLEAVMTEHAFSPAAVKAKHLIAKINQGRG